MRKQLETKQIADLRNTDGENAYKSEHLENLKESGSRFLDGFSLKNAMGRLFWAATVVETISIFLTESMQRHLYDDSVAPEQAAKEKIGVFSQK